MTPLVSTFAGDSARGEGLFSVQLPGGIVVTGGTIYSDSTYYYSTFKTTGTSTFSITGGQINADIFVVAGGGGGGRSCCCGWGAP